MSVSLSDIERRELQSAWEEEEVIDETENAACLRKKLIYALTRCCCYFGFVLERGL